jgi:hypothetical protein
MISWIHRLLNPHCEHCRTELEESRVCKSCETLKVQLEIANYEKKQLLEAVLNSTKPNDLSERNEREYEPLKPKSIPWAIRKQMLEAEDREKAKLMSKQTTNEVHIDNDLTNEIAKMEAELGVTELTAERK